MRRKTHTPARYAGLKWSRRTLPKDWRSVHHTESILSFSFRMSSTNAQICLSDAHSFYKTAQSKSLTKYFHHVKMTPYAGMVELVDSVDLGSTAHACRFESCCPHHIGTQVLIRNLRSFSFYQKWLTTRFFGTFPNKITFIVSKLNTQKSKLGDFNTPYFQAIKSR